MPAAYAHLTLVNHLKSDEYVKGETFTDALTTAIRNYGHFIDLGAVSPDYPYLALLTTGKQSEWAERMHLDERNGDFFRFMLDDVAAMEGEERDLSLAWCLGFVSHAVMDMTIHPVIELKVGPYEDNAEDHRKCEMYQDVHIFRRLRTKKDFDASEYFDQGVGQCSHDEDEKRIHPLIDDLWSRALTRAFPEIEQENGAPNIDAWHSQFGTLVGSIATEGNAWGMIPFARHVGKEKGLVYCTEEELERDGQEFIKGLKTPEDTMDYDQLFDKAVGNVADAWKRISCHVFDGDQDATELFGPWHLDTGKDLKTGGFVYWNGSQGRD